MKSTKPSFRVILYFAIAALVSLPSSALGSGFGIFTQGAAVVAHSDSPEAIFYNPALLNDLPGTQVEVGTTLIFADREFTSAATGEKSETQDNVFYPSTFYLTHQFNETFSAGVGVFNPFGLATTWPENWEGRYIATKSELTTFNINPVVSWRITPKLSVAAGLDFLLLDSTLQSRNFAFDVDQKFEGSGNGLGYNLGLLLHATDALSIGVSYRSKVKIDVDGTLSMSVLPEDISGETTLTLPQQIAVGIAYKPTDRLILEVGVRWEDWSSFDRLKIEGSGQTLAVSPRNWRSTFAFNAGGKYRINSRYAIHAGYLYGQNPVPDTTFDPSIPDSDVHLFCLGGEARFGKVDLSMAYAYQLQEDRTKSTNHYGAFANGEYDSDIHLLAMSFRYLF